MQANIARRGSSRSSSGLPAKLVNELMAHKTLALRTELASQPDLALRCVVFALAANTMSDLGPLSVINVRVEETDVARSIERCDSGAVSAYSALLNAWRDRLPAGTEAFWQFVSEASTGTVLDLLAVLVAPAIELRPGRGEALGDALCGAAGLDMGKWWTASVESYFEHVRKSLIVEALLEINPSIDRAKLDKAPKKEVLGRARRAFKGKSWLPRPPRVGAQLAPEATEPVAVEAE